MIIVKMNLYYTIDTIMDNTLKCKNIITDSTCVRYNDQSTTINIVMARDLYEQRSLMHVFILVQTNQV